jgi:hypothetical protein
MKNVCLLFYLIIFFYIRAWQKLSVKKEKKLLFDPEKWTTQGMHYKKERKKKKKTEDK